MKLIPLSDSDTDAPNGTESDSRPTEPRTGGMEDLVIAGVELDESQARVALFHVPDRPGYAALVFRAIAEAGVFVDMIVQNVGIEGDSVLSFTVPRDAAIRAALAVKVAGIADVSVEPTLAKLSVVGVGMRTHTGVATRMFAALAERAININLINTSEVRINVGTDIARGQEGLECLKRAFLRSRAVHAAENRLWQECKTIYLMSAARPGWGCPVSVTTTWLRRSRRQYSKVVICSRPIASGR